MAQRLPALIFGTLLILGSSIMLAVQRRAARRVFVESDNPREQRYLQRRARRRTQVAGMLLLIGMMIIFGDSLMENWRKAPITFGVYWLIVLGLTAWIGLLAIGDMLATRAFMTSEINQLERKQVELQNLARGLRQASERRSDDE